MQRTATFDLYDPKRELPLAGYVGLVSIFGLAMCGALILVRRKASVDGLRAKDTVVLGLATYQLTRIVTKDRVLAPFRAPFTKYVDSAGAGELKETSRGAGFQKAVGDLLTCPYCLAPWVATALSVGLVLQPRATRWVGGLLAIVATADVVQQGYAALKKWS